MNQSSFMDISELKRRNSARLSGRRSCASQTSILDDNTDVILTDVNVWHKLDNTSIAPLTLNEIDVNDDLVEDIDIENAYLPDGCELTFAENTLHNISSATVSDVSHDNNLLKKNLFGRIKKRQNAAALRECVTNITSSQFLHLDQSMSDDNDITLSLPTKKKFFKPKKRSAEFKNIALAAKSNASINDPNDDENNISLSKVNHNRLLSGMDEFELSLKQPKKEFFRGKKKNLELTNIVDITKYNNTSVKDFRDDGDDIHNSKENISRKSGGIDEFTVPLQRPKKSFFKRKKRNLELNDILTSTNINNLNFDSNSINNSRENNSQISDSVYEFTIDLAQSKHIFFNSDRRSLGLTNIIDSTKYNNTTVTDVRDDKNDDGNSPNEITNRFDSVNETTFPLQQSKKTFFTSKKRNIEWKDILESTDDMNADGTEIIKDTEVNKYANSHKAFKQQNLFGNPANNEDVTNENIEIENIIPKVIEDVDTIPNGNKTLRSVNSFNVGNSVVLDSSLNVIQLKKLFVKKASNADSSDFQNIILEKTTNSVNKTGDCSVVHDKSLNFVQSKKLFVEKMSKADFHEIFENNNIQNETVETIANSADKTGDIDVEQNSLRNIGTVEKNDQNSFNKLLHPIASSTNYRESDAEVVEGPTVNVAAEPQLENTQFNEVFAQAVDVHPTRLELVQGQDGGQSLKNCEESVEQNLSNSDINLHLKKTFFKPKRRSTAFKDIIETTNHDRVNINKPNEEESAVDNLNTIVECRNGQYNDKDTFIEPRKALFKEKIPNYEFMENCAKAVADGTIHNLDLSTFNIENPPRTKIFEKKLAVDKFILNANDIMSKDNNCDISRSLTKFMQEDVANSPGRKHFFKSKRNHSNFIRQYEAVILDTGDSELEDAAAGDKRKMFNTRRSSRASSYCSRMSDYYENWQMLPSSTMIDDERRSVGSPGVMHRPRVASSLSRNASPEMENGTKEIMRRYKQWSQNQSVNVSHENQSVNVSHAAKDASIQVQSMTGIPMVMELQEKMCEIPKYENQTIAVTSLGQCSDNSHVLSQTTIDRMVEEEFRSKRTNPPVRRSSVGNSHCVPVEYHNFKLNVRETNRSLPIIVSRSRESPGDDAPLSQSEIEQAFIKQSLKMRTNPPVRHSIAPNAFKRRSRASSSVRDARGCSPQSPYEQPSILTDPEEGNYENASNEEARKVSLCNDEENIEHDRLKNINATLNILENNVPERETVDHHLQINQTQNVTGSMNLNQELEDKRISEDDINTSDKDDPANSNKSDLEVSLTVAELQCEIKNSIDSALSTEEEIDEDNDFSEGCSDEEDEEQLEVKDDEDSEKEVEEDESDKEVEKTDSTRSISDDSRREPTPERDDSRSSSKTQESDSQTKVTELMNEEEVHSIKEHDANYITSLSRLSLMQQKFIEITADLPPEGNESTGKKEVTAELELPNKVSLHSNNLTGTTDSDEVQRTRERLTQDMNSCEQKVSVLWDTQKRFSSRSIITCHEELPSRKVIKCNTSLVTDRKAIDDYFLAVRMEDEEQLRQIRAMVAARFDPETQRKQYNWNFMAAKRQCTYKNDIEVGKKKKMANTRPPLIIGGQIYKKPKLYKPGVWATKKLYSYFKEKLEARYGMEVMLQAEQLVRALHNVISILSKDKSRPMSRLSQDLLEALKTEMALKGIITTHYDFYLFVEEFMTREFRYMAIPNILNGIPVPQGGVMKPILEEQFLNGNANIPH